MADEQRIVKTLFSASVDKSALDASTRALKSSIVELLGETRKQTLSVEDAAKKVNRELAEMVRKRALDSLTQDLKRAVNEGEDVADALKRASEQLAAIGASDAEIRSVVNSLEQMGEASERAQKSVTGLQSANDRFDEVSRKVGLAGDIQSNLGATRGLLDAAGATGAGQAVGVAGEVIVLAEELPRLKTAISGFPDVVKSAVNAIGVGNVGMIGAIAALTAVILLLRNEAAKTGEAAKIAIQASQDYNKLVLTGTTESLTAQRQAAEQELKIAQRNFEQAQQLKTGLEEGIRNAFGDAGLAIAQANAALGTNNQELAKVNENYDAATKALQEAQAAVGVYDRALQSNEVAANDAALAVQRQAEATQKLSASLNDIQLNVLKDASTLTGDQLQQRLEGLNNERKALEAVIASGTVSGEQLAQYNEQLQRNNTETAYLLTLAAPLVEAREREAEAVQRQIDAVGKDIEARIRLNDLLNNTSFEQVEKRAQAIENERSAIEASLPELEALSKQSEAGAAAYQQAQDKLQALNSEFELLSAAAPTVALRELNGLLDKLDGELAKIRSTYQESVAGANEKLRTGLNELNAELGKQQAKDRAEAKKALEQFDYEERVRKREHRQKLADIDRQFDLSQQQAIGDRDAVALQQAEQTRDEAKRQENERYKEENEARSRELKLLQDSIRAQQQATIDNYNQRRDALIAQNQAELQAAYAKYQQEFAARQQAYAAQTQQLQQFLQAEARIRSQAFTSALSAAGQALGGFGKFIGQAFNVVKSVFSGLGAGKSLLSGFGIRIPSFDTEGRVTKTGLAKVDEGELIVKESRLGGGGFTFAPNLYGYDRASIRQQVLDQLDVVLDRMGAT